MYALAAIFACQGMHSQSNAGFILVTVHSLLDVSFTDALYDFCPRKAVCFVSQAATIFAFSDPNPRAQAKLSKPELKVHSSVLA